MEIMFCIGMSLGSDGLRAVLDLSGRDSGPYARLKALICRHYGSRSDDRSVRHDSVIHDDRSHSHDHVVSDDASVYICPVADRHVVSDYAFRLLICRVQHGVVLDVHTVADADRSYVASQYSSIPDAAVIAHLYSSDYRRRLRQKRPFSYYGPVALEFPDYCHKFLFYFLIGVIWGYSYETLCAFYMLLNNITSHRGRDF